MLAAISESTNKNSSNLALKILTGRTTIQEELKYTGGFMTAVLKGEYETALGRADSENLASLTSASLVIDYEEGFAMIQEQMNYLVYKGETDNSKELEIQKDVVFKQLDEIGNKFDLDTCSIKRTHLLVKYYENLRDDPNYINWTKDKDKEENLEQYSN